MKRIIFCIVVILINFLLLNNLYNNTLINKRFIQVNTYFPSSQLCSCCRHRNEEMKDLKLREYKCSECGNILDRDINASLNILNEGIKMAFGL